MQTAGDPGSVATCQASNPAITTFVLCLDGNLSSFRYLHHIQAQIQFQIASQGQLLTWLSPSDPSLC